jgi:hypothetical protein
MQMDGASFNISSEAELEAPNSCLDWMDFVEQHAEKDVSQNEQYIFDTLSHEEGSAVKTVSHKLFCGLLQGKYWK